MLYVGRSVLWRDMLKLWQQQTRILEFHDGNSVLRIHILFFITALSVWIPVYLRTRFCVILSVQFLKQVCSLEWIIGCLKIMNGSKHLLDPYLIATEITAQQWKFAPGHVAEFLTEQYSPSAPNSQRPAKILQYIGFC